MGSVRCVGLLLFALVAAKVHAEDSKAPPEEQKVELEQVNAAQDAAAQDQDPESIATQATIDSGERDAVAVEPQRAAAAHPRFSDGPRAVPRARGASLARAQALGIGGHATTQRLLWSRPSAALLSAVRGEVTKSLLWPVAGGVFGRGFGYTRKLHVNLRHNGIDIGAKEGAPVRAAADGLVIYSDNTLTGFGNAVMILHAGGWTTLYGHNQRNTVQAGYYVKRGERIALVGHTGMALGPHLHFELRDNGRWRDPQALMVGHRDLSLNGPLVELKSQAVTGGDTRRPSPPGKAGSEALPTRLGAAFPSGREATKHSGGTRCKQCDGTGAGRGWRPHA